MANGSGPGELEGLVFDDIGPQRVFLYHDADVGLRAVLVIDTLRYGMSAGGVRMAADLTLTEMLRLARAMTYKFAMLDLPCGGAKAGVWLDPGDPRRAHVMAAFLEAIRPLLESKAYIAGADMGTAAEDFATGPGAGPRVVSLGQREVDGMALEDQLTGCGVVVAARVAGEHLGVSLRGASVALEGFGKVGAGVARFLAAEGARLVAVSTLRGTLHKPEGLEIDRLLALRREHGDGLVERYDPSHRTLPPASLFSLPVDVLVPGARPDAIHSGNVDAVRARLIVPGANIPYEEGCAGRLFRRGVSALPDFVTNAGGVLTGLVEMEGGTVEDAFATVRKRVADNVGIVLAAARERGCDPCEAGLAIVRRRLGADG